MESGSHTFPGRPCGSPPDPQLPRAQLQVQPLFGLKWTSPGTLPGCATTSGLVSPPIELQDLETPVMGAADQCLLSI